MCKGVCLGLAVPLNNKRHLVQTLYAGNYEDMLDKVNNVLRQASRYADPDQMKDMVKFHQEAEQLPAPEMPAVQRQKTG